MMYVKALLLGVFATAITLISFFVFGVTEANVLGGIYMFSLVIILFAYGWIKAGSLKLWLKEFI